MIGKIISVFKSIWDGYWIPLLFEMDQRRGLELVGYRFSLGLCDQSKCQLSVCLINAGDTNLVNDLLPACQGCQYLDRGELMLINSQNHLLLSLLASNPKALNAQRTDRLRWFIICMRSKEQFTKYSLFSYIKCIYYLSSLGLKYRYFENILSECFFKAVKSNLFLI